MFECSDGTTNELPPFCGSISEQQFYCEKNSVADFMPVLSNFVIKINKISIARAAITGFWDSKLAVEDPGSISHFW